MLSEDSAQRYIFVADGANMQIDTLDRQSGEKLASFGRPGRMAGEFKWVHNMAIDSKGNLYTAEVGTGGAYRSSSARVGQPTDRRRRAARRRKPALAAGQRLKGFAP